MKTERDPGKNSSTIRLLTFGYGNDKSPADRLFPGLAEYECNILIDVRDQAKSFNRPKWSAQWKTDPKASLGFACKEQGVQYLHFSSLGNTPIAGEDGPWERRLPWERRIDWRFGMRVLVGGLITHRSIAIMCCEGMPFKRTKATFEHNCHRVEIAHLAHMNVLRLTGVEMEIVHLRPNGLQPIKYSTAQDVQKHPLRWSATDEIQDQLWLSPSSEGN